MSEEKTSNKTTSYYVKMNRNEPQGPYESYFNDDEKSDEKPIEVSDEESQETDEESQETDEESDKESDEVSDEEISVKAYLMRNYHSDEITGINLTLNSSHQIEIWKNEEYKDIALKENNTSHIAGIKFMVSNDIKYIIEVNMGSSIFGVEWTDMWRERDKTTEALVGVLNYLHTEGYTLIK